MESNDSLEIQDRGRHQTSPASLRGRDKRKIPNKVIDKEQKTRETRKKEAEEEEEEKDAQQKEAENNEDDAYKNNSTQDGNKN